MHRLLVMFLVLPLVAQAGFPFSFWKPSALTPPPTPNVWYDASTLGLANGATVSSWPNKGTAGAPADATLAGSGTNAVYATYSQNGQSSVTFAAGKYYTTNAASFTYPVTIAIITKVTGAPGYTLGGSGGGSTSLLCFISGGNLGMEADRTSLGIIGTVTSGVASGGWHLFVAVLTSSTWDFYIDNTSIGSGSNSQGASPGGFRIGDINPAAAPYSGGMGEILIYNSTTFSSTQRAQLNLYSQLKWGTP